MSKRHDTSFIKIRGVRQNNLKDLDLDIPLKQLVVITGLSGSGKSSLAFETLFAEGQRRYVETFSPYARQFFDRMDKPKVDSIEGIPPAIAIEQNNTVRTTRSTVGTMTEITDISKILWHHLAQIHCPTCGMVVKPTTAGEIDAFVRNVQKTGEHSESELLVCFEVTVPDSMPQEEAAAAIRRQGYTRLLHRTDAKAVFLSLEEPLPVKPGGVMLVIQDRLLARKVEASRLAEGCEQAYKFGRGRLQLLWIERTGESIAIVRSETFSNARQCRKCLTEFAPSSPSLFSFNHPSGACPECRGFGRIITIDYQRAVPDARLSIKQGLVKPWRTATGAECQADLIRFCKKQNIPIDVPFKDLPKANQDWVMSGDPDFDHTNEKEWKQRWYGVAGYFRWLETKAYKMHVRVLLSRYRSYVRCPKCSGQRFQPESLLYHLAFESGRSLTLSEFYACTAEEAHRLVAALAERHRTQPRTDGLRLALDELQSRLKYLQDVGLGYLNLDRPTRSLSGGETERVNLTRCLGNRVVNTLFVLDEPTVGLHARDTERLVRIMEALRDAGNSVVVVEHDESVMRAANRIFDLGPGHGESGGELVFEGTFSELLKSKHSLTSQYLNGSLRNAAKFSKNHARPFKPSTFLKLEGIDIHNLKNVSVELPLHALVAITGVSGSGKTSLVKHALHPLLERRLLNPGENGTETPDELELESRAGGWLVEPVLLDSVMMVDQSPVSRTPRSNAAVYVGAFDDIRELFARSAVARQHGLGPSSFSFNSAEGQCPTCRGAGFEKVEMQFLSDIFIKCPDCEGERYRPDILKIKVKPETLGKNALSIADFLNLSADAAVAWLGQFSNHRHASAAARKISVLSEVGLGYVKLGQPLNTLSGGEAQRLKLARHLADFDGTTKSTHGTLFIFDEPTTGLHMHDVAILMKVLHKLVAAGHSVVLVEHNLQAISQADWIIDLGPEAGVGGGKIVFSGPASEILATSTHTANALRAR